jgi:deoxyribonuclease-4
VHHPQLTDIPKILETPFVGEDKDNKKPPYAFEIEMLRQQKFNEDLLDRIKQG